MKRLAIMLAVLLSACIIVEEDTRPTSRGHVTIEGGTPQSPVMCHDGVGGHYRVTEGYWDGCEWWECDWDGWIVDRYTCSHGCWQTFCDYHSCWNEWFNVSEGYYDYYGYCECGWWTGSKWLDDGNWYCYE